MKFDHLIGFIWGLTVAGCVVIAAASLRSDIDKPVLSKHAVLAIMACNELKLENESVQTTFNGKTDTYEITSQCSNNVKIHLTVVRKVVVKKET